MWGLAAHLIRQNYSEDEIREASDQWLHFIRPDYYVASALKNEQLEPEQFGFTLASSCYSQLCDTSFQVEPSSSNPGGCGGMGDLIQTKAD